MERKRTAEIMTDTCGDNRLEVIEEAKKDLLDSTNIEMAPD